MPSPTKKTAIMDLFGYRETVEARYGTLRNAHTEMSDMLLPQVPTPYLLGSILEGNYCHQEQADAVRRAVMHYIVKPRQIIENWISGYLSGELPELTIKDMATLADALGLCDVVSNATPREDAA